jgi:hypothetical protein
MQEVFDARFVTFVQHASTAVSPRTTPDSDSNRTEIARRA